jgi:hypothetical protein
MVPLGVRPRDLHCVVFELESRPRHGNIISRI